jgi:hypothetical protein
MTALFPKFLLFIDSPLVLVICLNYACGRHGQRLKTRQVSAGTVANEVAYDNGIVPIPKPAISQ